MRVMIYSDTMATYRRMRDQIGAGLPAEYGIDWLNPGTAHRRLMSIERGTLLLLKYRCEEFTPEMLDLIATRQIIVVPVHCSKCSNYGAVVLDTWEQEYAQELALRNELEARDHQALKGDE